MGFAHTGVAIGESATGHAFCAALDAWLGLPSGWARPLLVCTVKGRALRTYRQNCNDRNSSRGALCPDTQAYDCFRVLLTSVLRYHRAAGRAIRLRI